MSSYRIHQNQKREYDRKQGRKESMTLLKNMIESLLKSMENNDNDKLESQLHNCNGIFQKGIRNIKQDYEGYKSQHAKNIWYNIYYYLLSNIKKNRTHNAIHNQMKILVKK